MRQTILAIAAIIVVAGIVGGILWQQRNSPEAKRERLIERFLAVLPDSIDAERRNEIRGLMDTMWARADRGKVAIEDIDEVIKKMEYYIDRGRVDRDGLNYLMAQVGYYTYRLEPEFTGGQVDHPTLNPAAEMTSIGDSAFWAEFEDWKFQYLQDHPEYFDEHPEYREFLQAWMDSISAEKSGR